MLRFATWLVMCFVAGSASGAVIHVFPKFGAVYNPDQSLANPAVIAAVDPLASLDLAPRNEPYLVRFDFLLTIEDLTGEQLGFGNCAFNINLQGVAQSSALPGWIAVMGTIDKDGAGPGGIRPIWASNGDYGPSTNDLQSLIIGTDPRDFGPVAVDPRRIFGVSPYYNYADWSLVINQLGEYSPPWEGTYVGSLFVEIRGQRGSEGVVNTFVEEGSTYNAARLLSDDGVVGAPPANFRIRVVPEPSTRWLLLVAVVTLLFGAVACRRRYATRMPWRVLSPLRESISASVPMRFIRAQASVVVKDCVAHGPLAQFFLGMVLASALATASSADIYRWDTGEVIPGTEGIEPEPWAQLDHLDLAYAQLIQENLSNANLRNSNLRVARLRQADLSYADLANADLESSTLENARFTGARIEGANLYRTFISKEQLYSTESYQSKNLRGVNLGANDLSGWDFSGQDLAYGGFESNLNGTDFRGAVIVGVDFAVTTSRGFSKEQLYSTASFQQRNLAGIRLSNNDLSEWHFEGQNLINADLRYSKFMNTDFSDANLKNANFDDATLSNANFSGAIVAGARFYGTTWKGFAKEQLYSTLSYQSRELPSVWLWYNILDGWDFHNQNLTASNLSFSTFVGANLKGAVLAYVNLSSTNLNAADFSGAVKWTPSAGPK